VDPALVELEDAAVELEVEVAALVVLVSPWLVDPAGDPPVEEQLAKTRTGTATVSNPALRMR
jgi:hypothetical protein